MMRTAAVFGVFLSLCLASVALAQNSDDLFNSPETVSATQQPISSDSAPLNTPDSAPQMHWPRPVNDTEKFYLFLFDLLEYQRVRDVNDLNWSFLGWYGGDRHRLWIKSDGTEYPGSSIGGGQADLQVLYGQPISPFFDLQAGLRYEQHRELTGNPQRGFLVLGVQGLAPYKFDLEPSLFLSNRGKVSFSFTGTYDWLITQRLILQPRFETEIAAQQDLDFGVPRGVNDISISARLRYEIRREFAPYVGVSYAQSYDATKERYVQEGGSPNGLQVIFGMRIWY